jgi:hypothetical protein
VEEYGRLPVGEAGFKGDDPSEAGCLGDHEGDEDDVFHISVLVGGGWRLIDPGGNLRLDHLVAGDWGVV